jgi:myo-inositol-1(or 4)-monophosphatase
MRPPIINAVSKCLEKVAKGLIRDFGEIGNLQNSRDGTGVFVDVAIRRTESLLHDAVHRLYPTANLWMPMSGLINYGGDDAPVWIISGLDGHRNFAHGLPHFSMSMALKDNGHMVAGIVYDPLRHETFWAFRGSGAFLNQTRLRVSTRAQTKHGLLGTSSGYTQTHMADSPIPALAAHGVGVQSWGAISLDLAYVAAGRYDGFFDFGVSPHVMAAGMLLVKEAGGSLSTVDGRFPLLEGGDDIVAGNSAMHTLLKTLMSNTTRSAPIDTI